MRRGTLLTVAVCLFATAPVRAHTGHSQHGGWTTPVAAVGFLVSVVVLGASAYLDHTDRIGSRSADLGVGLGVLGLLVAGGLALV